MPPEHAPALGHSGHTGTLALPHFPGQTPFLLLFGQADRASQPHSPSHPPATASPEPRPGPRLALAHGHGHPEPALAPLQQQQLLPGFSSNPPPWQIIKPRQTQSCARGFIIHSVYLELHGKACNQDSLRQLPLKASGGFRSQQNSLSKPVFPYFNVFFPTGAGKRSSPAHRITLQP